LARGAVDRVDGVTERRAGRQVERDRHRGELSLVRDHQRRRAFLDAGDGGQRHLRGPGGRARRGRRVGAGVNGAAGGRRGGAFVFDLEHHTVLVELRQGGGDL